MRMILRFFAVSEADITICKKAPTKDGWRGQWQDSSDPGARLRRSYLAPWRCPNAHPAVPHISSPPPTPRHPTSVLYFPSLLHPGVFFPPPGIPAIVVGEFLLTGFVIIKAWFQTRRAKAKQQKRHEELQTRRILETAGRRR